MLRYLKFRDHWRGLRRRHGPKLEPFSRRSFLPAAYAQIYFRNPLASLFRPRIRLYNWRDRHRCPRTPAKPTGT
jgi:hypothetical protein